MRKPGAVLCPTMSKTCSFGDKHVVREEHSSTCNKNVNKTAFWQKKSCATNKSGVAKSKNKFIFSERDGGSGHNNSPSAICNQEAEIFTDQDSSFCVTSRNCGTKNQQESKHTVHKKGRQLWQVCAATKINFALLPDGCKLEVAAFLLPFEAYNLCLTSKHFHFQSSLSLLSTHVLKSSLLSSLAKVLRHNKTGITLENLESLQRLLTSFGLPANSFFQSGSTVVQACLGVLWEKSTNIKTDVDIFCSQDAAPIIRSWLVTANAAGPGHHIFTGANFFDQSHFAVQESPISHVEKFGKFTSTVKPPVGTISTDQHQLCLKNEESTKNAIQNGGSKQTKHLQDGIFVCTHNGEPVPFLPKSVTKNLYRMRVEDSVQFEDKVDLVVAKGSSSALDLLDNFDLDICRCSFNGINFSIPNPHNVFKNKQALLKVHFPCTSLLKLSLLVLHLLPEAGLTVSKLSSCQSLGTTHKTQH